METAAKCIQLNRPSLTELASVLENGLKKNFGEVSVSVVECPDLTKAPFNLAAKGLCGSQKVADVGGVLNLVPVAQKDKQFSISDVARQAGTTTGLIVGAGAGPWPVVGVNSEMMANVRIEEKKLDIKTTVAYLDPENNYRDTLKCIDTDQFALMANLYMCDGDPGQVLEVKASRRTGSNNYMSCIRETLTDEYNDKPVALGGTFLVEKGKAKLHIMPDFSPTPLSCEAEVGNWLRYYDYDSPLVAVGYLVSHDPGLDLRVEHFHCFSDHGVGGHYHYDLTPEEVEYRGYFSVADTLHRVYPASKQ